MNSNCGEPPRPACSSSKGAIFPAICRHLAADRCLIHEVILSDCTRSIHQCIYFSNIEALWPLLHRPGNINPHNWTRRAVTLHHTGLQISQPHPDWSAGRGLDRAQERILNKSQSMGGIQGLLCQLVCISKICYNLWLTEKKRNAAINSGCPYPILIRYWSDISQ